METHINFMLRCALANFHKQRAGDSHHCSFMVVSQTLVNWKIQCFNKLSVLTNSVF